MLGLKTSVLIHKIVFIIKMVSKFQIGGKYINVFSFEGSHPWLIVGGLNALND